MRKQDKPTEKPKFRIYSSYDPVAKERKIENSERRIKIKEAVNQESGRRFASRIKIIILISIIVTLGYFSFISNINVSGADSDLSSRVEEQTLYYLGSSPWRRFQFLLSSNDLSNYIIEKEPVLDSVDVSRSLFSKHLSIKVTSKRIVAIWQQGRGGQKYQLNEDGVVSSETEENLDLPLIVSDQQFDNSHFIGKGVVDGTTLNSITVWAGELKKIGLVYESFEVSNTPRQFVIKLKDKPFYLLVSSSGVEEGVKGLSKTLEELKAKNITPSKYIDIRIPYRVYYQ